MSFLPGRGRYFFIAAYTLAAFITGLTVFITAAAPATQAVGPISTALLTVLGADLALILALVGVGLWRVLALFGPQTKDAGLRLHRRFVGLFALAAVAPAVIVALFFGLLVTRGVESWFSSTVRNAVDNSATIAKAYVHEQTAFVDNRIPYIVADLNRAEPTFRQSRMAFSQLLLEEAAAHDFDAIYLIDADGRVLARAEQAAAPPFAAPPPKTLRLSTKEPQLTLDPTDMARAVFRLAAFPDAYVYLVRPLGEGVMGQLRQSEASVVAYREAARARGRIQLIFALSYVATALLVLVGAVGLGIAAASQIAAPVARLVQAADRVASGDLAARVLEGDEPAELAVLFPRLRPDDRRHRRPAGRPPRRQPGRREPSPLHRNGALRRERRRHRPGRRRSHLGPEPSRRDPSRSCAERRRPVSAGGGARAGGGCRPRLPFRRRRRGRGGRQTRQRGAAPEGARLRAAARPGWC